MRPSLDCEQVRELLFALPEDGVAADERSGALAHLTACARCRDELLAEQALTALLGGPPRAHPRRPRARWLAAAATLSLILVGAAVGLALLEQPRAYGSISPSSLLPSMTLANGSVVPLQSHNHVDVALNELVRIEILGVAVLNVIGPTVLELDRAPESWKLVLLKGQVRVQIAAGETLLVSSLFGARTFEAGEHLLRLLPALFGAHAADDAQLTAGGLLQQAIEKFFAQQDMAAEEQLLRDALAKSDITAEQRSQALFYLGGALGRQQKLADAIATQDEWLRLNPADSARHYVLLFQGIYYRGLGKEVEARQAWETIVREAPGSDLAKHAEAQLGGEGAAASTDEPHEADRAEITRPLPAAVQNAGGYVVVAVDLDAGAAGDAGFLEVAHAVAKAHRGTLVESRAADLPRLIASWHDAIPQQVLFVVRPDTLDVDLHRRILLASAALDADVFPDFAFGYFTARNGDALKKLWQRTQKTLADGLPDGPWLSAFVTGGTSNVYEDYLPQLAQQAGFRGRGYGVGVVEKDKGCLAFAMDSVKKLPGAAVIEFSGNGDPQGIWLFDDHRNVDASKHWPFSPEKVGHDPEHQMPRIRAKDIAALALGRPVVWSGTCHSAATRRVYVEGDIVSTFGVAKGTTIYDLPPDESLCLAMLDAGAVAYLAPIAANHGYSLLNETEFALLHGASLGETIKSTYDDVCLAAGGALHLDLHDAGAAESGSHEQVMQGAGANRLLIGDPALSPFHRTARPGEKVTVKRTSATDLEVEVTWDKGFHPRAWDIFGTRRDRDWRVYARLAIDDLVPAGKHDVTASVAAWDDAGAPLPYVITRAEPETYHGHRYLHLQANVNRDVVKERAVRVVFTLKLE